MKRRPLSIVLNGGTRSLARGPSTADLCCDYSNVDSSCTAHMLPRAWCDHYPSEMRPDYRKTYRVQPGHWNNIIIMVHQSLSKTQTGRACLSQAQMTLFHLSWLTNLCRKRYETRASAGKKKRVHVEVSWGGICSAFMFVLDFWWMGKQHELILHSALIYLLFSDVIKWPKTCCSTWGLVSTEHIRT